MESARADLDYAFVARWANANDNATLTAIDASFVRVATGRGPLPFAVAGRIRLLGGKDTVELGLRISLGESSIEMTNEIEAREAQEYAPDRRHILFAANTQMPVLEFGLTTVEISLDGDLVRTLRFEIVESEEP